MLTFILRLLTFVWMLWILRRILGLFIGRPAKTAGPEPKSDLTQDTVKDPVCGMYMDPRLAIRGQGRDGDIFFCSEECRNKYAGSPRQTSTAG